MKMKTKRLYHLFFFYFFIVLCFSFTSGLRPRQYNRVRFIDHEPHGFFGQLDSRSLKDNSIWNTKDNYLSSKRGLIPAPMENEDEDNEEELIRKSSITGVDDDITDDGLTRKEEVEEENSETDDAANYDELMRESSMLQEEDEDGEPDEIERKETDLTKRNGIPMPIGATKRDDVQVMVEANRDNIGIPIEAIPDEVQLSSDAKREDIQNPIGVKPDDVGIPIEIKRDNIHIPIEQKRDDIQPRFQGKPRYIQSPVELRQKYVDAQIGRRRDDIGTPSNIYSPLIGARTNGMEKSISKNVNPDYEEIDSSEGSGADNAVKREVVLVLPTSGDKRDVTQIAASEGADLGSGSGEGETDTSVVTTTEDVTTSGVKEEGSGEESGSTPSERSYINTAPKPISYNDIDTTGDNNVESNSENNIVVSQDNVINGEESNAVENRVQVGEIASEDDSNNETKRQFLHYQPKFVVRNGYVYMRLPETIKRQK